MSKIKTQTLSKNVKIDPQEYVLQGFPSLYYLQKLQNIDRTLFWLSKIKTAAFPRKKGDKFGSTLILK